MLVRTYHFCIINLFACKVHSYFFFKIFFLIKFNIFSDSRFFFSGEVRLTEKDFDTILSEADVNNDGKIDYEEFVKMLTNAEL